MSKKLFKRSNRYKHKTDTNRNFVVNLLTHNVRANLVHSAVHETARLYKKCLTASVLITADRLKSLLLPKKQNHPNLV